MQPNPYANYPANNATGAYNTAPYNTQPGYYAPGQPTYPAYPTSPNPAPHPSPGPGYYPNTTAGTYYAPQSYATGTYPTNYTAPVPGYPSAAPYPNTAQPNYGNNVANYGNSAAPNYGTAAPNTAPNYGTAAPNTAPNYGTAAPYPNTAQPNYGTATNQNYPSGSYSANNYPSPTVGHYSAPANYGNPGASPQPTANYPSANYPANHSYSSPNLVSAVPANYTGPYPATSNYGYSQPNLHSPGNASPNYARGGNSPLARAASTPVTGVTASRDTPPSSGNFPTTNAASGGSDQPLVIVYKKGILKGVDAKNIEITDQALVEVPSEVLQISGLSVFKFSRNRLTAVPKRLCGLGYLTILDLSHNQIKKIPSQIALLNHLRILMLNNNEIPEVPLAITSCTALEELHLQQNKIESVPLNLVALNRLVLLDLGHNSLNALSNDLQQWTLLRTLRINDNRFTELPTGIDKLPNLEVLEVQGNQLSQLPANIGDLPRLEVLKAGNCHLSSVPASVTRLTGLTALHLNNNKFTELPTDLYALTTLRELCLQSNEVSDVSPHVIKLSQLSYLDLSNNKLQSLPYQIGQMRIAAGHTSLRLEGNPFTELIPREIMLQGTPAIISFLRMLNTSKSSWRRVKLVLVGQEEVGKTSLRKALVETSGTSSAFGGTLRRKKTTPIGSAATQASGDTVATDGIDIEDWTLTGVNSEGATATSDPVTGATTSDLTFSCWDFGGQEVYYPTHQFFLTTRSVYMLIFNLVDISASRIEYWLKALKLRAPTAPVVLVGTHLDDKRVTDKKVHREILNEMKQKYQSRFPMIKDYCAVSSKNGKGLKELKARLIALALQDPAVNQHVPMSYVALEANIKKIRPKKEIMSLKEFKEFVAESGIEADEDVITVLKFMNDVGVISYFSKYDREQSRDHIVKAFESLKIEHKGEEELSDIVILNPQWLSDVMSSIVTLKHNYVKDGVLTEQILPHVWRDYPQHLWPLLIDLLSHFEVAQRLKRAPAITGNKTPASGKRPVGPKLGAPRLAAQSLRQGLEAKNSTDSDSSSAEQSPRSLGPIIVPCLLPETPPTQLFNESWPEPFALYSATESAVTCPVTPVSQEWIDPIGRDFLFKFLPLGFASRLITRTLQLKGVRPITCWRSGMIIELDLDKSPQRALLIADEARGRVLVRIRTRRGVTGVSRGGLMTLLCDNISTLGQWARARPGIEVPCPHCLASVDSCQKPSHWALTAVLSALRLGDTELKCHRDDIVTPVNLSSAAPDVMFDFGSDTSFVIEFNRLELLDKVAEGAFAALYRARAKSRDLFNEDPAKVLAVKQLLQQEEDFLTDSFSELQHETFMMCNLQHDCLVALRGISLRPLALVMDFYPLGALDKRLRTADQRPVAPLLAWPLRLKIAQDIARGMAYLHSEDVIHRDLRSPNVLLVALDHHAAVAAKVTDFGTAQMLAGSMRGGDLNENWCAPEVLLNQPYDLKADVYSYGIILWELLQIGFPFAEYAADWSGKPTADFGAAVQKGLRPSIPSHVPAAYSELVQHCWHSDPQKRPNFYEIVDMFPALYAQATKWM